ncbi:MAG: TetR/AcrR family transcriptional regulator [Ignavibacteriaceae bacterium]|nr:TetR/AcrR family transcriptional regulator [Ignavibacteriaceae bacterium]
MGTKERKERQKAEMREAVLSAALRLFSDQGYEYVTMRKIADEIEYSVGTIYLYFKDKDEIFFELHKLGFEEFYKRQIAIQNVKDPLQRLKEHGLAYIQFAIDQPQYYDLMFISRIPAKTIKQKQNWTSGDRTYELLKLNIVQAKEAGYFKGVEVEVAAFSLWSFVHGISSLFVRDRLTTIPMESVKSLIAGSLSFLGRAY